MLVVAFTVLLIISSHSGGWFCVPGIQKRNRRDDSKGNEPLLTLEDWAGAKAEAVAAKAMMEAAAIFILDTVFDE